MNKKSNLIFIILIFFLSTACGRKITESEARTKLHTHLFERHGEEFEIGYMERRSDGKLEWYEAEIYPSKYMETVREYG